MLTKAATRGFKDDIDEDYGGEKNNEDEEHEEEPEYTVSDKGEK